MVNKAIVLVLAALVNAVAYGKHHPPPAPPPALPICSVLSKPAEYDGKEVVVRGIYRFQIHWAEFFGSECRSRDNLVSLSSVYGTKDRKDVRKAWRKIGVQQAADVVLRGTFVVCYGDRGIACSGGANPYEIKVRECLFVQPVQLEPK